MSVSLDFKRGLKTLWAESSQGKMPSLEASYDLLFKSPFRNSDPLNEVLTYLALNNTGHIAPPLVPRIVPMPVAELCQLAILWACAKETESAAVLALSIPMDFPWMWCKENEYKVDDALSSISLLSRAIGREAALFLNGDPYFEALSHNLLQFAPALKELSEEFSRQKRQLQNSPPQENHPSEASCATTSSPALLGRSPSVQEDRLADPPKHASKSSIFLGGRVLQLPQKLKSSMQAGMIDCSQIETASGLKCCYTFLGSCTSVGSLISNQVEIRAFGPQAFPLSDPKGFGIRLIANHDHRWASSAALPEIWFDMKLHRVDSGIMLDLSFFGMKPTAPLAFSFYVKAKSAQIGNETFKPKTLQRYHGISKPIQFENGLQLESLVPGKMELIPLAGSEGYWDCEYLIAFEIHPLNAKMSFFFT